jgi:hypothetical protein
MSTFLSHRDDLRALDARSQVALVGGSSAPSDSRTGLDGRGVGKGAGCDQVRPQRSGRPFASPSARIEARR